MERPAYEAIIQEAITALPKAIREGMKDVLIMLEEEQPKERGGLLLGLYEGIPLTQWGREMSGKPPDKITLFRQSIEQYAHNPEEIPDLIRETLWHEIAHYFGFGHDRIGQMEKRWRKRRI